MSASSFDRMREMQNGIPESEEPSDFVKDKKTVMRTDRNYIEKARELKKTDQGTFKELKNIIGKTKPTEEKKSIYKCWKKQLKGR